MNFDLYLYQNGLAFNVLIIDINEKYSIYYLPI